MAINKTINSPSKSKAGMRNCIEYVLKAEKTDITLTYMTGPAPDVLNWNSVYQTFMTEKEIWNKTDGRLYAHNVISFHEDEKITQEEALEFGKEFVDKWFPDHQSVIAIHRDKAHIHVHIVTNSVSYVDGKKLHNSNKDLQRMKDITNQMCREKGLTVAEKGKHFNGEEIEQGELIAWSKDKYNLINNGSKKSYVADCAVAILEALEGICESISDFINAMQERGWKVNWSDTRKNITFENEKGEKVRDSNISKTFNMDIGKEALINEFERQKKSREERDRAAEEDSRRNAELEQYYSELKHYIKTEGSNRKPEEDNRGKESNDRPAAIEEGRTREGNITERCSDGSEGREDIGAFLEHLNANERNSEKERADREAEQRRLDLERKRELEREEREASEKRKNNKRNLRNKNIEL